ncbi:MAG: tetratricopeptide repeat protein [Promethearchaeota archaeon]
MSKKITEELELAEQLMYKAKFDEALEKIISLEKHEKITPEDQLSGTILKGKIYCYKEDYKKAIKAGERAYQLSQKVGNISKSIDALFLRACIGYFGKLKEALDYILEAEKLLNSSSSDLSSEFTKQKLDYLFIKSLIYNFNADHGNALGLAQKWLNTESQLHRKLDISRVYWHIGEIYLYQNNLNLGLEHAMKSLKIQKEIGNQVGIAKSFYLIALSYYIEGKFDQALEYSKKCLMIDQISTHTNLQVSHLLGAIYKDKGELERTLRYYNKAAELSEKEDYTSDFIQNLMGLGATYRMKGDLNRAIEYLKRSFKVSEKINSQYGMSSSLFHLVLTYIDMNLLEEARFYLNQLEQLVDKTQSPIYTQLYKIVKALVLKNSGRIRNRTEAELLLKENVETEYIIPISYLASLVNLCDLYLEELYITNNSEVLNDLIPLINKMLQFAEKQNSYLWLSETKLLQAKLALIQMKVEEAKQLLTHAQRIAELHGLSLLASKISNEHDNLLIQLHEWENLREMDAPMSERIKLASFEGIFERMQGKRVIEPPKLTPEIPVLLLIIGEGGFPLFSHQFVKNWTFEDDLLSGFLTAFNTFSGEFFSKDLDRAKFGEHTILLRSVDTFSVCYLFKGQTYLAKQKLTKFTEKIQITDSIWNRLNKFFLTNRIVELKDLPELKSLISEIFLVKAST